MTPLKVILALKRIERECPFDYSIEFKEAIKLIKKQVKKKVIIKYPSAACPQMIFKCPVCKCELDDCAPDDYCPDCGQAIDWS